MHQHRRTRTHFQSQVLGSRLSRPGSPLRAPSQGGRDGWRRWITGWEGAEKDVEIFQRTSVAVSNLWAAFFQPAVWPTDSLAWLTKNYESFRRGHSPCLRPGTPHMDVDKYKFYHMRQTDNTKSDESAQSLGIFQKIWRPVTDCWNTVKTSSSVQSQIILGNLLLCCEHVFASACAVGAE